MAAEAFTRALNLIPLNKGYLPDLIIKTGLCLYKLGKYPDVVQLLNRFQAVSPQSPALLFLCGLTDLENGDLVQAERNIKECMQKLPAAAAGHFPIREYQLYQALGDIYGAKEAWNEAVHFYFLALQAEPNYIFPVYRIIEFYRERYPTRPIGEFLSICPPDKKCSLLARLLPANDTEAAIFLLLGLCRDIMISDLSVTQLLAAKVVSLLDDRSGCPLRHFNDWKLNAAVCLTRAFLHIALYKGEPGDSFGLCEKLWENMQHILFIHV